MSIGLGTRETVHIPDLQLSSNNILSMSSNPISFLSLAIHPLNAPFSLPRESTPLLDIILVHIRSQNSLVGPSLSSDFGHLLGRRWNPLATLHWCDPLKIHRINFFERPSLALNEEEVDNQATHEIAGSEDVAVAEVNRACDERCEEGDEEVPEPGSVIRPLLCHAECRFWLTSLQQWTKPCPSLDIETGKALRLKPRLEVPWYELAFVFESGRLRRTKSWQNQG